MADIVNLALFHPYPIFSFLPFESEIISLLFGVALNMRPLQTILTLKVYKLVTENQSMQTKGYKTLPFLV